MHIRRPIVTVFSVLIILLLVGSIGIVVYFNSLYYLLDRTEITGNPTIAERDLIDPEDLVPEETDGTTQTRDGTTQTTGGTTQTTGWTTQSSSGSTIGSSGNTGSTRSQPIETTLPDASPTPRETTIPAETTGPSASPGPSISPTTLETSAQPTPPPTFEESYPIPTSPDVYNILLIGTDNRGDAFSGRSDSMMILSINKRTRKIHLVSLMRGLYVKIEGHEYSMLNNSFSWGGVQLLLQTIKENFRVQIDDYLLINFAGFKQAIDIVGGVDIRLSAAEIEYLLLAFPEAVFKVGSNLLNGEVALCYARIRQIDSDYRRTARQRKVIENLISRLSKRSPAQIDLFMRRVLPLMKTNLSKATAIDLAVGALQFKSYPVSQLMLPLTNTYQTIIVRGAQMVSYDAAKNVSELQRFLYED